MEAISPASASTLLLAEPRPLLAVADANCSEETLSTIVSTISRSSRLFGLATSSAKVRRWIPSLPFLHYFLGNRAEMQSLSEALFPSSSRSTANVEALLLRLARAFPSTAFICTAGADGAFVMDLGNSFAHIRAYPCSAVLDVTGAGDSMAAGIIMGLLLELPLGDAVRLGSRVASATISAGSIRSCPVKRVVQDFLAPPTNAPVAFR